MSAERPLCDGREAGFSLIETMRWQPGDGLVRRELHLARLVQSAAALGFALSVQAACDQLDAALADCDQEMRVRLELSEYGQLSISTIPFTRLATNVVWQLRIASCRLDSSDPLLRHKTSRRTPYEAARGEFLLTDADEVLLLNERSELCEGTITSLFVEMEDGPYLTPALSSGLLDGVLRRQLIMQGRAKEAILFAADLSQARRILVGNSLRGLIPARLAA